MKHLRLVHTAGLAVVTVVMAFVLLHYTDYIYKFQALSSLDSGLKCFFAPGGLLALAGRALTSLCRWPVLGGLLFVCLLAGLSASLVLGFRKSRGLAFLGVMPSVLVFLFISRLGYRIYALDGGVFFSQALGLVVSALVLFLMRRYDRTGFAVLAVIVGYGFFGFYALLPALVYSLRKPLLLVAVALVPVVFCLPAGSGLAFAWLAGTPSSMVDFGGLWPLLAAWVIFFAVCALPDIKDGSAWWAVPAVLVYGVCVWSEFEMPYRWSLFHHQVAAERLLEEGRWAEALDECNASTVTNDALVAYRNAALFKMGCLAEDCIKYSLTIDQSVQPGYEESLRLIGPTVYFYSGLFDLCAETCRVLNASIAPSRERLTLLLLCISEQVADTEEVDCFSTVSELPESAPDMVLRFYAGTVNMAPEYAPWHIMAKSISLY